MGDLWLPSSACRRGPLPVIVMLHGGFWRSGYTKVLMTGLARDACRQGWAVWNVEYRRLGPLGGGGGWPHTFLDAAAAIDHVTRLDRFDADLGRVVAVGHSAGGLLALWAAGRGRLPVDAPGSSPLVRLAAVVSLAGVTDLRRAATPGGDVVRLMGGSSVEVTDRYFLTSPVERLPLGVPQLVVHGRDDRVVPVARSAAYVEQARAAGDDATFAEVPGGHRRLLLPSAPGWTIARAHLHRAASV